MLLLFQKSVNAFFVAKSNFSVETFDDFKNKICLDKIFIEKTIVGLCLHNNWQSPISIAEWATYPELTPTVDGNPTYNLGLFFETPD